MVEAAQNLVLQSVKGFLSSSDYSDLTITCQSDIYKVHKVVVCSRAKFFENALNFPGQESESNAVDLPEDDPAMVKLLVQYLYEGDYSPYGLLPAPSVPQATRSMKEKKGKRRILPQEYPHTCSEPREYCMSPPLCIHHSCGDDCVWDCNNYTCQQCLPSTPLSHSGVHADQLLTHASMYAIGDQYSVIGLKQLSKENFRCACLHFWNEPEFPVAAQLVFSTTVEEDKGLRDMVIKTIADHMELVKKPEIEVLMTQFNGISFGLLKQKVSEGWR